MRYHNIGRLWAECMSKLEICHPAPGTLKINMKWAEVSRSHLRVEKKQKWMD